MEEAAAGTAVGLGDFDSHHAEVEELVDERPRDLRMLVHFADERPDLRLGKRPHAVAEDGLVLGQNREGLDVLLLPLHDVFGHDPRCYHCRSEPAGVRGRLNGVICETLVTSDDSSASAWLWPL
jgi:hypothetical protein